MAGRPDTRAPPPPPEDPSGAEAGDARKPFLLRLPAPLMAELRAWAGHEVRSLNGQIEFILRRALREAGREKAQPGDRTDRAP